MILFTLCSVAVDGAAVEGKVCEEDLHENTTKMPLAAAMPWQLQRHFVRSGMAGSRYVVPLGPKLKAIEIRT